MFNHQGGPRGGDEFVVPNWWMGMAPPTRRAARSTLTVMLSLEPATLGSDGYRHIFQVGETLDGQPLIDRQHPHDFLMQAAAVWREPLGEGTSHACRRHRSASPRSARSHSCTARRRSTIPCAPLGHHTFDSTPHRHGCAHRRRGARPGAGREFRFHGGEPDEQRWDLMDPGALDSWSVRGWYRPSPAWTFQLSHGFLNEPEALEEGDVERTTASITWLRNRSRHKTATTAATAGTQSSTPTTTHSSSRAPHTFGANAIYGRFEATQVETGVPSLRQSRFSRKTKAFRAHVSDSSGEVATVDALTVGGVRTLARPWGFDLGAGADVTFYNVPTILQATHGETRCRFTYSCACVRLRRWDAWST